MFFSLYIIPMYIIYWLKIFKGPTGLERSLHKHKQEQTRCCLCVEKLGRAHAGLRRSASGDVLRNRGAFIWAGSKSKLRAEAKYWHMAKSLPFSSDCLTYISLCWSQAMKWKMRVPPFIGVFWRWHTPLWLIWGWGGVCGVRLQNTSHFVIFLLWNAPEIYQIVSQTVLLCTLNS